MSNYGICPECGKLLVARTGRYGKFLGCIGYPKCKYTGKIGYKKTAIESKPIIPVDFIPTDQQAAIARAIANGGNILVSADAGTGKTTAIRYCVSKLGNLRYTVLAFNKSIANELNQYFGGNASTLHSLGLRAMPDRPKVEQYKVANWLYSVLDEADHGLVNLITGIVSYAKNTTLPECILPLSDKLPHAYNEYLDALDWQAIAEASPASDIPTGSENMVFAYCKHALVWSDSNRAIIDFDDMLRLPVIYGFAFPQTDIVFIDEAQDLNLVQFAMIEKLNTRIVAVGDEKQAIYIFRGAMLDSIDQLKNRFDMSVLPLTKTWRNAQAIIEHIKAVLPYVQTETMNPAIGLVDESASYSAMLDSVQAGDFVICRNNAPLVKPVFSLLKAGKTAYIAGKDIGAKMASLIGRIAGNDSLASISIVELSDRLNEYYNRRAEKTRNRQTLDNLRDEIDTIIAIAEESDNAADTVRNIESLFGDEKPGVMFSTIHRVKGLEANRVWILNPHLIGSKAVTDADIAQEKNLRYVAMSRAILELRYANTPESK